MRVLFWPIKLRETIPFKGKKWVQLGLITFFLTGWAWAQPNANVEQAIDRLIEQVPNLPEDQRQAQVQLALDSAQKYQYLKGEVQAHLATFKYTSVAPSGELAYQKLEEIYMRDARAASPMLHNQLGDLYFYLKEGEQSIRHYNESIKLARLGKDSQTLYLALTGQTSAANIYRSVPEALPFLREAVDIAFALDDLNYQIEALNQLATIYMAIGEVDSALRYFEKLVDLKREKEMYLELSTDLQQFANMFILQGVYEKAQSYLFEALSITEELNAPLLKVGLLTDIGASFVEQEIWEKVEEYAIQGLELAQELGLSQMEAANCNHLGKAYQHMGKPQEALAAYQKSLDIYENQIQDPAEIAKLKLQLGSLQAEEQNDEVALTYLQEALAFKTEKSDKLGVLDVKLTIAPIYIRQKRFANALQELRQTEELAMQLKSKSGLERTYQWMSEAYASMGNYTKAYQYQELFVTYHDSIYNERNSRIIHELETAYQAAKKDQKNAELRAEIAQNQLTIEKNQITILEQTRQQYILIGSIGALTFLVIFLVYRYKNRQKLLKQSMITLQKEYEAQNLRAVITGEEQERQRIARDLHDGIGPLLASIKMLFQAVQNERPEIKTVNHYQQANKLLDQASQEVREISHNMMPGTLDHLGLKDALRDLCTLFRHSYQIDVDFITHGSDEDLDHPTKVTIYRITQELLRNIAKHAKAEEVIVQMIIDDDSLQLTVEDDGEGFVMDKVAQKGIGLKSIRSRTVYLKGNLDIDTKPKEGTTIHIEIPLSS